MLLMQYALLAPIGYVACAEWFGVMALHIANRAAHRLWAMLPGLLVLGVLSLIPFSNTRDYWRRAPSNAVDGAAATRIRASTTTAPAALTITGLQSSSAIAA